MRGAITFCDNTDVEAVCPTIFGDICFKVLTRSASTFPHWSQLQIF